VRRTSGSLPADSPAGPERAPLIRGASSSAGSASSSS
jgi:hypothetical protein